MMSIYNCFTGCEEPIFGPERDSEQSYKLGLNFGIYRGDMYAVQMSIGLRIVDASELNTPEELDYLALTRLAEGQHQARFELASQLQPDNLAPLFRL